MHDFVASLNRVILVSRISNVRYAAGRFRYQRVAGQQFAGGYGHSRVAVGASVIGPLVASRGNRDRYGGGRHRQLAVHRSYSVVSGCTCLELVALHFVRYRALARERDAAFNNCFDLVVAYQAFDLVVRIAVRCAVIGERFARRRHRHSLRIDCQLAGCIGHHIVFGNAGDLLLIICSQVVLRAFRYIGNGRSCSERSHDACLITAQCTCNSVFTCQRLSIKRFAVCLGSNCQRQCVIDSNYIFAV